MSINSEVDKAEFIQAVKAFLIPASLFIATIITSAGIFLLYYRYSLGWALVVTGGTIMASAFVAFCRFHNKLRARGHFRAAVQEDKRVTPQPEVLN